MKSIAAFLYNNITPPGDIEKQFLIATLRGSPKLKMMLLA
jgi:hypothetical protein